MDFGIIPDIKIEKKKEIKIAMINHTNQTINNCTFKRIGKKNEESDESFAFWALLHAFVLTGFWGLSRLRI